MPSTLILRTSYRTGRIFASRLTHPSTSTTSFARIFSSKDSSDDGGNASNTVIFSALPQSNVHSPYADSTKKYTVESLSKRLISTEKPPKDIAADETSKSEPIVETVSIKSTEVEPKEVPSQLSANIVTPAQESRLFTEEVKASATPVSASEKISDVDREIQQQYELAKAIPKTNAFRSFIEKWGLTIDKDASDEEKKRQRMTRNTKLGSFFVFGGSFVGLIAFCLYYGRGDRDEEGKIIKDEFSGQLLAPFYRINKSFRSWIDYVVEPSRDKLLPDPLPPGYIQPKYTIVIEMKNVLVSPEWTYKTGYRFKLRPALEYFLDVVGYPNFEVVVYTSESSMTADPIVTSFDPKQRIMYRLYRDCTKYQDGHHIKDLSRLNRDLSKVIHIDFDPNSFSLHPENVLRIPKWDGDMVDTALVDLAELLKTIHLSDVEDVRPVLQYYSQFDDPTKEFRKRAIYLSEMESKSKMQHDESDNSLLKRYSGRLFGFRRHASA